MGMTAIVAAGQMSRLWVVCGAATQSRLVRRSSVLEYAVPIGGRAGTPGWAGQRAVMTVVRKWQTSAS